jgi:orotate phosphoribosyltransferase
METKRQSGHSEVETIQRSAGRYLARHALKLGAVKLRPEQPFQWASGYYMPIYNDNRLFLGSPFLRRHIAEAFRDLCRAAGLQPAAVAGTATAGIPHAATLADLMQLPLMYVRSSQKTHGMQNQIEGIPRDQPLDGTEILLIEDLISMGGSSIAALSALRARGASVSSCFAIFSYQTASSQAAFAQLDPPCRLITILNYDLLLSVAAEEGYIDAQELKLLSQWREDPLGWGEKQGYPPERNA